MDEENKRCDILDYYVGLDRAFLMLDEMTLTSNIADAKSYPTFGDAMKMAIKMNKLVGKHIFKVLHQ